MQTTDNSFASKLNNYHPVVLQLLYNRGIKDQESINVFLNPDYEKHLIDPFLFNQMDAAVNMIIDYIKNQDLIIIYGDYDADGVTSSAVLTEILSTLNAKVDVYIPDRVREGYGMNKKSIDEIVSKKAKLIITVDNGIRNKEEVAYAKSLGLDIIITDHHVPPEDGLPDCIIINPKIENEAYSFKHLAGVGVAFKLAQAIISRSKIEPNLKIELSKRLLDLVAIGTVADCVSLTEENRVFTSIGLQILNRKRRKGLNELMILAKINDQVSSWHIGWLLAPRINAAGRIVHAHKAYELLTTKNIDEAKIIAKKLDENNTERQKITDDIVGQVEEDIQKKFKKDSKIIIAVSPGLTDKKVDNWNEGVMGLAASRICDRYYLPTIIITANGEEVKGSGRSIEEFHITKALEEASEFLEKFGGHSAACGFSLKRKDCLEDFKNCMTEIANRELGSLDLKPKIKIEMEINLIDITEDLVALIDKFEPFGEGNSKPKFLCKNVTIIDIINMGADSQHLKLRLKNDNSKIINAIGFGQAELWKNLKVGNTIDIVFYLELNKFNGRSEVQLKIIDIKESYE